MANLQKFTSQEAWKILKHNLRQNFHNKNCDIDKTKSHLNYSFTPKRSMSEYEYFKKRKAELYCYNRSDVKTMASWIVSVPNGLDEAEEREFFKNTADFLMERYGVENSISLEVHKDEGVKVKSKDRWGNKIKNEDGSPNFETVGKAHLHYNFIPVIEDNKHIQKYKVCAKEVLNPQDLKTFHKDLSTFLRDRGVKGWDKVYTGVTAQNGGNRTIEDLKKETKGITKSRTIEKDVSRW